jgi:anti-anti-sigma regulatory factor
MTVTATAVVDRVHLGDHVCWAHDDKRDALDAVTRFTATGLRLGHKVICFTDTFTPRTLRAHLEDAGVPTETAVAVGQLRIVPAVESYVGLLSGGRLATESMIETLVGEIDRAHREGYPGLRLAGDMGWTVRTGTTLHDLSRYEAQVNRVFLDRRVAGMCLYDRRHFPPERLHAVAAAHPGTVGPHADRAWTPLLRAYRTADPPGLRLVGQVDRSNQEAFAAVLAAVTGPAAQSRPAVLDLSGLSFADVRAATALVRADRAAAAGVRLVGCRPGLSRLLGLVRASEPAVRPE